MALMAIKNPQKYASPSEHHEQVSLLNWWNLYAAKQYKVPNVLLYAIPNGGARNIQTGAMLKAEGVRAGIPDLHLALPRGDFHSLYIELKRTKGGRLSPVQAHVLKSLRDAGHRVEVCHGWIEAKTVIENYLQED